MSKGAENGFLGVVGRGVSKEKVEKTFLGERRGTERW